MGLLSKLLGKAGEEAADRLTGALKDLTDIAADRLQDAAGQAKEKLQDYWEGTDKENGEAAPAPSEAYSAYDDPSRYEGLSYGPYMPAEENQFNYPGPYDQYFLNIFREEFPQYEITLSKETRPNVREACAITFRYNGGTALMVELLSGRSMRDMLRRSCKSRGIPYLRFYYDHDGWWNTRSYVLGKAHEALGV